jgi:hypothetical protein
MGSPYRTWDDGLRGPQAMFRSIRFCCIAMLSGALVSGLPQSGVAQSFASLSSDSVSSSLTPSSSYASSVVATQMLPVPKARPSGDRRFGPFSTVAFGVKMSTLGAGIELATPLSRSLNLRGGASLLDVTYPFSVDGTNYAGSAHFRSGQAMLDWFPFRSSFHISPGILIYHSLLSATASVPGGNNFELDTAAFTSSSMDPVHGSASLNFGRTIMPALTLGFGNLIPRSGRHWSAPFEVGGAYMGHNTVDINLLGTACTQLGCLNVTDPLIQQHVIAAQDDVNEAMKHFQIYPIVSTGFALRF